MQFRPQHGQDQARESGAAAHVGQGANIIQVGQDGHGVEQVMGNHGRLVAYRGQVVGPVPLGEQGQQPLQPGLLLGGEVEAQGGGAAAQGHGTGHAGLPAGRARARRFRCTSSREMAAGVTP